MNRIAQSRVVCGVGQGTTASSGRFLRMTLCLVLAFAVCAGQSCLAAASPRRPNIVFILSDDHACQTISCYGSQLMKTPNIDRLASAGMRFDRAFCTESLCGPSRASIMTGKYGHITGAKGWAPYDRRHRTFPEYLQGAGYQTAMFGKYHMGDNPPGFDEAQILPGQGRYRNPELISRSGTNVIPGHVSDVLTDLALQWLDRRDPARPFLVCIHHKATHMPWEPAERYQQRFAGTTFPEPPTLFDTRSGRAGCLDLSILTVGNLLRWQTDWSKPAAGADPQQRVRAIYQEYMRNYLATAAGMDEAIGRVLDYLDQHRLADDTIVIYSSDQGFFMGEHGWFDKRWMLEESLRLPLVVRYPRVIKPGSQTSAMVVTVDFAPTLLDFAGISVPSDMQGRSLRPLLAGGTPPDWRRSMYYRYYDRQYGIPTQLGVRTDRYKLIHYAGPAALDDGSTLPPITNRRDIDEWELFDLQKDPDELVNLYPRPESSKLVNELKAELQRLREELGDKQ